MKRKRHIFLMLAIFTGIFVNNPNVNLLVEGKRGDAYFIRVDHPESKIYQYDKDLWNFSVQPVVYNEHCAVDDSGEPLFFFKFYRDGELWWNEYENSTYKVWRCNVSRAVRGRYQFLIPTWRGPRNYDFKIELYWDNKGTPHLLDTTSFSVTCVLAIHSSDMTVISYAFVYSLATFLLLFYLLLTRPYKLWT